MLETLAAVASAARKRKAEDAGLSNHIDDLSEEKSAPPFLPSSIEDFYLLRNFNSIWRTFLRPELEKVHAPFLAREDSYYASDDAGSPPPPPPPQPEDPIPPLEIPSPPLAPLTHGGGLDEDEDQSCVLTQQYSDCSCAECTLAATQPIDQFSDAEEA